MEASIHTLSVCSFNCRSLKKTAITVSELCSVHDILLLREHWLLPHELSMLNSLHMDFNGVGLSADDTSVGLVNGRPDSGTAILYRSNSITVVDTNSSRITGIHITSSSGKMVKY